MTPDDLRAARGLLGLTQAELGKALRLNTGRAVRRWEAPGSEVPGPVQVAVELMVAGLKRKRVNKREEAA